MALVRRQHPTLLSYHDPSRWIGLGRVTRGEVLALLGESYLATEDATLREGIFALAFLVLSELIELLSLTVDLDLMSEALLLALLEGRPAESYLRRQSFVARRSEARLQERHRQASDAQPQTARQTHALVLMQGMARLSPRYQQVAGLLAAGYKDAEIASHLHITPAAAWKLIQRTRDALREIIF